MSTRPVVVPTDVAARIASTQSYMSERSADLDALIPLELDEMLPPEAYDDLPLTGDGTLDDDELAAGSAGPLAPPDDDA